ncbi:hypothetical protein ABMA28_010700 [Loxostege sticticalis]|uniref:Reverse transcriptase domain-containing protein n=1 Tax=Loxostege sticticalis TaxID=481309 RepID=A0ABD0S938_LOXSC
MLFADDIVLVAEVTLTVQNRLAGWRQRLENVGLKIIRKNTEYLFCDFGGLSSPLPLTLAKISLPVCSEFRYLGSFV